MKNNIIKTYIRDENRNPKGVVILVKEGDSYQFGYSLCAPCDRFNKEIGTKIAFNRAIHADLEEGQSLAPLVADRREQILEGYVSLEKRAARYFKEEAE